MKTGIIKNIENDMKLKKLILSTAFIALSIQTSVSSELPIGTTTVNLDPFFAVHNSI